MISGFGVVIALKNIFTDGSEEYLDPVSLVAVVATSDAALGKPERCHQRKQSSHEFHVANDYKMCSDLFPSRNLHIYCF